MEDSTREKMQNLEYRLDWIRKQLENLEKMLLELFNEDNANSKLNSFKTREERLRTLLSDLNDAAHEWIVIERELREKIIKEMSQARSGPPTALADVERILYLFTHFKRLQSRTQYLLLNVDLSFSVPIHNQRYLKFLTCETNEVHFQMFILLVAPLYSLT
jgi:DNA repair exonuclease SbcCD ATPase subunit